jgi:hypothetical protein
MILSPIQYVVGHEEASVGCHIWVYWWAQRDITQLVSPMIFYPTGADVIQLYGSDLLSPILFSWIPLPPSLLYNFWVVFLIVLGGMGIRRLVLELNGKAAGAFVGGMVFSSGAFFHHEILNGAAELLSASTLPWFTLYLLRILKSPTLKTGLTLGIWAGVATALSAYNPFFLLIITLCVLLAKATESSNPIFVWPLWKAGLMSIFSLLCFLIPIGWLHLTHGAGDTFSRRQDWLNEDSSLPDSFASVFDWFNPQEAVLPVEIIMPRGEIFEYWTTCTVYLGWVGILLLAYGLYKKRWVPQLRPFLWMFFVALLIAMGPYLRVDGEVVRLGEWAIPLPTKTIAYLFPPFIITALHAYRYSTVVLLGFAVLIGRMTKHWGWALVILLELIIISPVPWPVPVTKIPSGTVVEYLRDAESGAVFTAPMARENLHDLGQVFLLQIQHEKPIHDGGIHRRAGKNATTLFSENPMVDALSGRFGPSYIGDIETLWSIRDLLDKGYKYIVVPIEESATIAYYQNILGNPRIQDAEWALWEL